MSSILFTALLFTFAVSLASTADLNLNDPEPNPRGWNELLNSENIFEESVNVIEVKSEEDSVLLEQFQELLNQNGLLDNVYIKYRGVYEKGSTDPMRRTLFKEQLLRIARHNLEANSGKHSWWMGVNQFTDMTQDEVTTRNSPFHADLGKGRRRSAGYVSVSNVTAPASLNYVEQNRVSLVKNQLGCDNACAIFAFASVMESADAILENRTHVLDGSVQELVDCATPGYCCDESAGCKRSQVEDILKHITSYGLTKYNEYPYNNPPKTGKCITNLTPVLLGKSYEEFEKTNEAQLKQLLADKGPVAIYIYASPALKQSYSKGVFDGADCGSHAFNHAVALVGYGTQNGQDYWLIKNSWGQKWGNQGFLKLKRGQPNLCDMNNAAVSLTST